MRSLAISTACPRPSCSFCRTYATWARSLIARTCRSISMSPFSSSRCSSSKDRSKWSAIARFWLEVTMITCSIPAATASSTAYWMIGLSTSGSISFGCALVAGRKRVPQPAAGKTAFRTRKRTSSCVCWAVPAVYARLIRVSFTGRPPTCQRRVADGLPPLGVTPFERPRERPNRCVEGGRAVEVGQMRRACDPHPTGVARRMREGAREEPEREVVLAVDDEGRSRIRGESRDESLAGDRPKSLRAALRPEPALDDRLRDGWRVPPSKHSRIQSVESGFGHGSHRQNEGEVRQRPDPGRFGGGPADHEAADEVRLAGRQVHRHM